MHHWLPSWASALPAADDFEEAEWEAARLSSWYSSNLIPQPERLVSHSLAGYHLMRVRHALSDLLHGKTRVHVPFQYVLLATLFLFGSLHLPFRYVLFSLKLLLFGSLIWSIIFFRMGGFFVLPQNFWYRASRYLFDISHKFSTLTDISNSHDVIDVWYVLTVFLYSLQKHTSIMVSIVLVKYCEN